MASLQLVLLGGFQARSPTNAALTLPVKKAKALLAYLALHPGQPHLRDKLAALLWEDSSEAQARHSLRQALVCLRKTFPETAQVIQTHDDHLTLPPQVVDVDVLEFERLTNVGTPEALEPAVALYQGELLEGFNPGSSRFEDWLMERRSSLRERAIAAAETLLVGQLTGNPGERAIALALRLLSWDPLRESAQRTLMELYRRLGRSGAALKQYRACRAVLQRELGVEPEPPTEALYQQLLEQRRTAGIDLPLPVHRPPGADAPHESLAVRVEPLPPNPSPSERSALEGGAQRRQVSILAARLAEDEGGEPLDLEERHAAQQDLLRRVQASSGRLGGSLIPSAPDTVMVIFGVPQAHGNDAERAVRAALAIQQGETGGDALGHRRPVRIGLASGLVVASPWHAADPPDYRVTGDAVQEADRWCAQAGPAEIVISDALYASLQQWVVVEALAGEAPTRYALACLLGDSLRETGAIEESIAAFEQALTQAPTGTDQAQAWIGVAHGLSVQDRYAPALDALNHAQHLAGSTENAGLRAQIHYQRGNLSFPMGRIDACFREHEQALHYARTAGSPTLEARALSGLGDAYYQRGRMVTAHHHFEQCVALCREHGLAGIEAANLTMRGLTRFYQNDLVGAEQDGTAAVEIAARIGDKRDESLALNMLGLVYQHLNRWTAARDVLEKSLELARILGARQFEAETLGNWGFVTAMLGQQARAEGGLERAWALSRATGAAYAGPWLLSLWALVTKDRAQRSALLQEGEMLLGAGSVSHNYLHFYQNAMEAALTDHDWSDVERYAAALAAYTAAEPLPWSDFFIARATLLVKQGRGDRGSEVLAEIGKLHEQAERIGYWTAAAALRAAFSSRVQERR